MPEICPVCGKEHKTQEELEAEALLKSKKMNKKESSVQTLEKGV